MGKKLKILNKEYSIESELPSVYMEKIAEYVDVKFRELSGTHLSLLEIAVLSALNITDELFQERDLNKRSQDVIKQTVEVLEQGLVCNETGSLRCS